MNVNPTDVNVNPLEESIFCDFCNEEIKKGDEFYIWEANCEENKLVKSCIPCAEKRIGKIKEILGGLKEHNKILAELTKLLAAAASPTLRS